MCILLLCSLHLCACSPPPPAIAPASPRRQTAMAFVARQQTSDQGQAAKGSYGRGEQSARRKILNQCVAGYLGGLSKFVLVHPLDTLTTLLEVSR
eukprot:62145-Hanusia_phi.AAC.1